MKKLVLTIIGIMLFIGAVYAQFTAFDATQPVVKPAVQEKVYNKYWLQKFVVEAPNPGVPAGMTAVFVPYDGVSEIDPNGKPVYVVLNDLFGTASQDYDIATAMEATFRALKKLGVSQGVFKIVVDENIY